MKKFILIAILAVLSFSDNIIQRGVNKQLEYIAATGNGSDTLPFTQSLGITSPVDEVLNSVIVIDPSHHEIHEGSHFYLKNFVTLTNQDSLLILLTVDSVPVHVLFLISPQDGEGIVSLYRGATASDSGDTAVSFNSKHSSSNTATMTCYTSPTISAYGESIYPAKVGSGKFFGGVIRGSNEMILDTGTVYLLVLDNNTTSANTFDYLIDWYEHSE